MTLGAVALATLIGAVLGVVVHLALPEVGATGDPGATQVQVAGAQLNRAVDPTRAQRDRLATAVFRVATTGCGQNRQATAIAVQTDGRTLIVTNAHVVRGSGTATLQATTGTVLDTDVLGSVSGRDAALLRLPAETTASGDRPDRSGGSETIVPIPVGTPAQVGESVAVAGYPGGAPQLLAGSVVSIEPRSGYGGSTEMLVVDAPAADGLSGSAVLDGTGRLVGLVAARDPGSGYVVAYPIDSVLFGTLGPIPGC